jgi:predicted XRE-type DNA-binding protein
MKRSSKVSKISALRSSGNVFADLGLPNADEALAKAKLVVALAAAIKAERLTQFAAAKRLGLTQPKISGLLRGRTEGFTIDKIMALLRRMKRNIDIRVTQAPAKARTGHVRVSTPRPMYARSKRRDAAH